MNSSESAQVLFDVKQVRQVLTTDGQFVTLATGCLHGSGVLLGQEPQSLSVLLPVSLADSTAVTTIDYAETGDLPACVNQATRGDAWGVLGSHCLSGQLWYGEQVSVALIASLVRERLTSHLIRRTQKDLLERNVYHPLELVLWNFTDGTALCLFYYDKNETNAVDITGIYSEDVVSYQFGANANDILAHEVIIPTILSLLNKSQINEKMLSTDDMKYLNKIVEEPSINNTPIEESEMPLVLQLAYHLYCTLMQWHLTTNEKVIEENPEYINIAKLLVLHKIENSRACT